MKTQVPDTWLNSTIPYKPYLGNYWAYADCIIIRFNRQVWLNRALLTAIVLNRTRTTCSPKRTPRTSPRAAATTSALTSAKAFPTRPLPASAETYSQTREDSAYGAITNCSSKCERSNIILILHTTVEQVLRQPDHLPARRPVRQLPQHRAGALPADIADTEHEQVRAALQPAILV